MCHFCRRKMQPIFLRVATTWISEISKAGWIIEHVKKESSDSSATFPCKGIPLVKVKLCEDSCQAPSLEDVLTCIEVGEAFTSTTEMAPMAPMERAHRCFARHFQLCLKLAIFLVVRQSIAFDDLDMVPWRPWQHHTATIVCQHSFIMFHNVS